LAVSVMVLGVLMVFGLSGRERMRERGERRA
jgi:hypothetical protein